MERTLRQPATQAGSDRVLFLDAGGVSITGLQTRQGDSRGCLSRADDPHTHASTVISVKMRLSGDVQPGLQDLRPRVISEHHRFRGKPA